LESGGLLELFINLTGTNPKISIVFNLGNQRIMKRRPLLLPTFSNDKKANGRSILYGEEFKSKKSNIGTCREGKSAKALVNFVRPVVQLLK
jgi:hypothetical protein